MTLAQRLMFQVGFARYQWFRRWVGGRWTRRYAIRPMEWVGAPIGPWLRTPPNMWTELNDTLRMMLERTGKISEQARCAFGQVEVWPTPELRRAMPVARQVRRWPSLDDVQRYGDGG